MTEVNEVRGKDKRTIRTTVGLVKRIDESYNKDGVAFYNSFKFGGNWYKGVFFAISDSEGLIQHAEFPREFSPPERDAIVGNYISYQFTRDSVYKGDNTFLNRFIYGIEVLNNPEAPFRSPTYKGWKVERIICFDTKDEEERS